MPIDMYKSQKRGGKGIAGMATREEDFVKKIFTASTHDTILFFSNKGKVYTLKGYELPEAGRTAKGTAIVNLLRLDQGEKITAVIPIANFAEGKYLLMSTKNGMIKKTALSEYSSVRKNGLLGITLKENDQLIGVRLTDGEDDVVLISRENATLLAITENGFGKRTELDEYRVQTRGGKGILTYKITAKTGNIVGIRITTDEEDVMIITENGTIIRLEVKDINILGRTTQGVTLMRTNEGKVVSIETISPEEEE